MIQFRGSLAAAVSLSLIATSTAAVASTEGSPQPSSSAGWLTLSMLTPSGAAVLDSTALAAAQPDTMPPPPPPPPTYTGPGTPPIPVIILWLAVLGTMVYIATKGNHHHPVPNSPA